MPGAAKHFEFLDPLEAILSYFQSTNPLIKQPEQRLHII